MLEAPVDNGWGGTVIAAPDRGAVGVCQDIPVTQGTRGSRMRGCLLLL